jgi:hypothetical protein
MRAYIAGKVLETRPLSRRGGDIVTSKDGRPLHLTKLFDGVGEVFEVVGSESGGVAGEDVVLVVQVNLREYNGQKQLSLWLEGRVKGALPESVPIVRPEAPIAVRSNGRTYSASEPNGAALAGAGTG